MFWRLRSLLRNLAHRDRMQRDLDEEVQATFDLLVDEKIAAGMRPWEARRAAQIELGGVEPLKEKVRDVKMGVVIDSVVQDIKHASRHFQRSPGFAVAAILTLALGIGATTAMFSILNGLLLRRLPIPDPDGLVSFTTVNDRGQERYVPFRVVPELGEAGPFAVICGYNGGGVSTADAGGTSSLVVFGSLSGGCFDAFGVAPILGRTITAADAPLVSAGLPVTVISHRFWTRAFNKDPGVLGRTVKIETAELTVIGVMPEGFGGLHVDSGIDLFVPPGAIFGFRADRVPVATEIVGRLRSGITLAQAAAQLEAIWPGIKAAGVPLAGTIEGADSYGDVVRVRSAGTGISLLRNRFGQSFLLMTALTSLLLVLMCVNIGGLLLTRLSGRTNELAVRLALGGTRARVARQMLTEGLLLSCAGTALAVPTAFALVGPIRALMPPGRVERTVSLTPDASVLVAIAIVGIVSGVMITALPIWIALRRQSTTPGFWDRSIAPSTGYWSRGLLVAQVAVSAVILIGASLLARSVYLLERVNTGVKTEGVLDVGLFPRPGAYQDMRAGVYARGILDQVKALPGVRSAAMSQYFPALRVRPATPVTFVGREDAAGVLSLSDIISPDFFATVGVPLIAGRDLRWDDVADAPRVCVITEGLARALDPEGDVLQRRIRFGAFQERQDLTIVGIVGDMTMGDLRNALPPVVFVPPLRTGESFYGPNLFINGRSPESVVPSVRQIVDAGGREFVREVVSLETLLERASSNERLSATLAAIIGGLAVLLAVIGIHGVLAFQVAQRRREIGLRVAIGANPLSVAAKVVRDAAMLTGLGLAIGTPAALAGASLLRSLLYGVSESDALSFAGAATLILLIGIAAGVLPALRAARVDPIEALRAE